MNNLRQLLAVAVIAVAGASVADSEFVTVTVSAPKDKVEECKTQRCVLVTKGDMFNAIRDAYKLGRDEAEEDMDTNGCKRGST